MAAQRDVEEIDTELRQAVARRAECKTRISALSAAIVTDTKAIDRLLAERHEAATPN